MADQFYIIDFDSTIIQTEGLEELAAISLKENPKREEILKKIKETTNAGMEGKITFRESLKRRLELLSANKTHIDILNKKLRKKISPSFLRNKQFLKLNKNNIYILSGGFKEFVWPTVMDLGIAPAHVFANTFKFNKAGKIIGFDLKNPLSKNNGKAEAVKKLNLKGEILVIGDSFTDLQIKRMGVAKRFIAFTENITREVIVKDADQIVRSFDEFLFLNKLPMSVSYPKTKMKVLLLENIESSATKAFEREGYQVEILKTALDEDQLSEKIKDISILGIRSKTKITRKVLENANKLKVVGAFCIGTEQMDLEALTNYGVCVFNAPYQNTRSVVELAIGEMIMLIRGVFEKSKNMHMGLWDKSAEGSFEIRGKTLGIIGYGNIGTQLSTLAEGLGMKVIFYDLVEKLPLGNAKAARDLNQLLKISDVISLHISGGSSNANFLTEKHFSQMKEGVIFINLSRGSVVDVEALTKYVKNGRIGGVAVDVFPNEPKSKGEKFSSTLQGLPNVILTPHIAGSTQEAQKEIANFVSSKIIDFINTGTSFLSVNYPSITLPEQKNSHRLLHLHKNVPGILAQINKVLADSHINIIGQYLRTNDSVGYLITDVNKKYNAQVLEQLKKIPDTIRFRVLY